jgi:hypothetical protein
MRKKINNPVYMTADDIRDSYKGKWILIANAKMTPTMVFTGGVPVVVADGVYEGHEDGFYEEFVDNEKCSPCLDLDYRDSTLFLANAFFDEIKHAN